jgi:hypothetical protein
MYDPYLEPDAAARKRMMEKRAKWARVARLRDRMSKEELEAEEERLEAEKLAFLAQRDAA